MLDYLTPTLFLVLLVGIAIALLLGLKLAKEPEFGLVLMAFFLPFERIPSLDIGGFTFKINHFIGALTFVFWFLAVALAKRKLNPNPLIAPLMILFFSFLLSGLQAQDQFRQFTVYISMAIMLALYLTTAMNVTNKKTVQLIVGALFLAAGLMGIVGIYQFFADLAGLPTTLTGLDPGYTKVVFGFPRIHALSKEPLYYANYLFIPLGVSLALFFSKLSTKNGQSEEAGLTSLIAKLKGPWLLPLIVLLAINFLLTLSRGAYLSAVPFALIFVFFYFRQIFTFKKVILGYVVLLISLAAVYNILESVSPDALQRFVGHAQLEDVLVSKQGESGFGRLQAFQQAIDAWETSPIVGIGLGNFGPFVEHYPTEKPGAGWDIVNNEYLELLAETGILGLLTFLLIAGITLVRSITAYHASNDDYLKAVLVGLTAALVAILVQYNFFSTLYIIHIWVLFGLIVGLQTLMLKKA